MTIADADVEEEVAQARERYQRPEDDRVLRLRSRPQLHPQHAPRSRVVEKLVDDWLAAHPEHPALPHLEDDAPSAVDDAQAEAKPRSTRPTRAPSRARSTPIRPRPRPRPRGGLPPPPASGARAHPATPIARHRVRSNAGETHDARPDGHRIHQPGGTRVRHLLAAAAGADHLPRRRDRGSPREPDHRPAPVPRVRGPGEGHQPVHQLARRRRDQRPRDLRHDAVPAGPGEHDLHRHGGLHGGGAPGRWRARQALRPAATAGS